MMTDPRFGPPHFDPSEDRELNNYVWAVSEVRAGSRILLVGTAWIIEKNRAGVAFITAAHVLRGRLEHRRDVSISLLHLSGSSIPVRNTHVEVIESKDLAFVVATLSPGELCRIDPRLFPAPCLTGEYDASKLIGQTVFNLGFPLTAQRLAAEKERPSFEGVISIQRGRIRDLVFDGRRKHIEVDYPSEPGFSGGPLFLEDAGQVIGTMASVILPETGGGPPTTSMAISLEEVYDEYNRFSGRSR